MRIAPRNYSSEDTDLHGIEETRNEAVNRACADDSRDGGSAVVMIMDPEISHEQEEGDVTDRYLIKESLQVSERT